MSSTGRVGNVMARDEDASVDKTWYWASSNERKKMSKDRSRKSHR